MRVVYNVYSLCRLKSTKDAPMLLRLPFTLFFLLVMVVSNLVAGTLDGILPPSALVKWGISHDSVREGEVFRLVTGTFLSHDLGMFLRQILFAATVIGAYEWVSGSRRAAITFVSIDIVGTMLVLFVILPALVTFHPSVDIEALAVHDVGMSAGGFGLLGALIARLTQHWLILFAVCVAIFVKVWISFDLIADAAHLVCLFLGFAMERLRNASAQS